MVTIFVFAGIVFSGLAQMLLSGFASEEIVMDSQVSGFGEAATQYAQIEYVREYNWKFTLIRYLRNYSFIILMAYFIWKTTITKTKSVTEPYIKRLLSLCCGVLIIALSFMSMSGHGAEVIGYRYLYMLGIPLCIILTHTIKTGVIKPRVAILLLMPAFLYAEGFIFGKILSF